MIGRNIAVVGAVGAGVAASIAGGIHTAHEWVRPQVQAHEQDAALAQKCAQRLGAKAMKSAFTVPPECESSVQPYDGRVVLETGEVTDTELYDLPSRPEMEANARSLQDLADEQYDNSTANGVVGGVVVCLTLSGTILGLYQVGRDTYRRHRATKFVREKYRQA